MAEDSHHEQARFFAAAKLIAALTMLSRVLGLVRDMVIVPIGSAVLADRFWTAFSIPNLFRRLFGEGALSAAFVPVFTEVAETEGWEKARLVLANVSGVLAAALAVLVVVIELSLWGAWGLFGGDWTRLVLLQLTGLMLPFMFTVCLLALGSAALHCKGRFAYPAFAPIILNVGLIVGAAWLAPAFGRTDQQKFFIIAVSLLVAGVAQLVGVVWLLRRTNLAVAPRLRPLMPEARRIWKLMAPMVLPLSVLQLSAFADRLLALVLTRTESTPHLPLTPGVVRCLYAANRLYQLPLGVLAISIATVVFPLLSRYAARNDRQGLREASNRALRLGAFLGIPSGVALILLARPIVTLIFQRGQFTAPDTERAALILRMYCVGMWAYFWNHVLLRAFFAQKDARTPLIIACALAGVNVLLVVAGVFTPLRGGAIGLATALTQSANALLLVRALRKRWGRLGLRRILASLVRTLAATACMSAAILGAQRLVLWQMAPGGETTKVSFAVVVAVTVPVGAGVFLMAARVFGCGELAEFRRTAKRKRDHQRAPDEQQPL